MSGGHVYIVSGPPGSGKTTVARELAARFERSVHIENDQFFSAIRSGFIDPWLVASEAQNKVILRAAAAAAAEFALGGYAVVVDGVVIPRNVAAYTSRLAATGVLLTYAVLLPGAQTVLKRGLPRPDKEAVTEAVYRQMHRQFAADAPASSVIDFDAALARADGGGRPRAGRPGQDALTPAIYHVSRPEAAYAPRPLARLAAKEPHVGLDPRRPRRCPGSRLRPQP